jgi:hypothetical protein
MHRLLLILLAGLALHSNIALAIVNGEIKSEFDQPEIIRLILVPADEEMNPDSGVAISESIVLTAGHCILDEENRYVPHMVRSIKQNQFEIIKSVNSKTEFIPEEIILIPQIGPVPGCSLGVKPLFETKTLDIALLKFPKKTFKSFLPIDTFYSFTPNSVVELFGFGSKISSFASPLPLPRINTNDLGSTQAQVMRSGHNRLATISNVSKGFADTGDSGGPVIANQKVIGILNTVEEKCETEFGEDYAILNSFTLISSQRVLDWILKNTAGLIRESI